jgi:SAM-dependent methyltransferase
MMNAWWETFFDSDYLRIWEGAEASGNPVRQVDGLWSILALRAGASVLDAPCGYGRISRVMAERGVRVLGVDFSADMLAEAERRRDDLPDDQLRYLRHDLRKPLDESGFDCALNLFSSLGYGTESEDQAILATLRSAVRVGGHVFIETNHRDRHVAQVAQGRSNTSRLPDGTLFVGESHFDPVSGRVETTYYWSGPAGSGQKSSSIRLYTITELVRLVEAVGLRFESVHRGCFPEPFADGNSTFDNRIGLLAVREE